MITDLQQEVKDILADARRDVDADMPDIPYDIRQFLGRMGMLKGVPTEYLLPSPHYLAAGENSGGVIKFFYIDREWMACMLDGALSVGGSEDRSVLLAKAMAGNYVADVYAAEMKEQLKAQMDYNYAPDEYADELKRRLGATGVRMREDGRVLPSDAQNKWSYTGFVLRSPLVKGWEGIEITALGRKDSNNDVTALEVIRREKVGADILLCICEGTIEQVDIVQPPESFAMGVMQAGGNYKAFGKPDGPDVAFRPGGRNVIDIASMAARLGAADSINMAGSMRMKPMRLTINITWQRADWNMQADNNGDAPTGK